MTAYYAFSPDARSFLIHSPATPRPWMNHLWNASGYQVSVSQTGNGESQYLTANNDLTTIIHPWQRHFYLRDDDRNISWNPGFAPLGTPLDDFVCEHNLSFTELRASKDGIASQLRILVPQQGTFEIWRLRLENQSSEIRRLSVFPFIEWNLYGNYQAPRYFGVYPQPGYEERLNGIFCPTDNPYAPHKRFKGFMSCSLKPDAYEGRVTRFLGRTGSPARPELLLTGRDLTNSRMVQSWTCAILQNKLTLLPGERCELIYAIGVVETLEEAIACTEMTRQPGFIEQELQKSADFWERIIAHCAIETPDEKVNRIINIWTKKQMLYCRVGKKGVRDNMQIADGVLQIWPEGGREEILEVLSHQFRDGHTVLTWLPYDDTYYSDQPIWLVMGVAGYIKETGDYSILEEIVPYQDGGEGTVWEHLQAGLTLKLTDVGPHGICRIHYADWNDALNIWTDPDAESVMVSQGVGLMLKEMAEIAERIGEAAFASRCREQHLALAENLNQVAWNGDYYVRAFHKDGVVGDKESEGSTIYTNTQTWAILGDIVPPERLPVMLRAMDERLEHEFGMPINWPPYTRYTKALGRMSGFPPGLYENGGVYCHSTAFTICANAKAGRGDAALRLLHKIMPDAANNPSDRSGAEPYVFTNCYFTHPTVYGESFGSWMTGTSAWCFKGVVEWIIGVRRDYDGLRVDPCLPAGWTEVKVRRVYRRATYLITIHNPAGRMKGVARITVDGRELDGVVLPVFNDNREHLVEVFMEGA